MAAPADFGSPTEVRCLKLELAALEQMRLDGNITSELQQSMAALTVDAFATSIGAEGWVPVPTAMPMQ